VRHRATPSQFYYAYFVYDGDTPCEYHEYYIVLSGIETAEPFSCRSMLNEGNYRRDWSSYFCLMSAPLTKLASRFQNCDIADTNYSLSKNSWLFHKEFHSYRSGLKKVPTFKCKESRKQHVSFTFLKLLKISLFQSGSISDNILRWRNAFRMLFRIVMKNARFWK